MNPYYLFQLTISELGCSICQVVTAIITSFNEIETLTFGSKDMKYIQSWKV
jgi:hypothetical protein